MEVEFFRPKRLGEALHYRKNCGALPFAGGTDLMVRHRGYSGTGLKIESPLLYMDEIEELRYYKLEKNRLEIGAGLTLTDILAIGNLPKLLRLSIEEIAAPGIRNRATLAGNICNASPAGDSLPPLYVHNAEVRLLSEEGERVLSIGDFLKGPGKTALKKNELLASVRVPILPEGKIYYRKIGTRKANALSKLSAAGYACAENGIITDFRFSLGAVAPTVILLTADKKEGFKSGEAAWNGILSAAKKQINPISDQRSTACYRRRTALKCLHEFLQILEEI